MLDSNRSFVVTLLLCIVTGGLYSLYLIYKFAEETNLACAGDGKTTAGLVKFILLSIVTLDIYSIVWGYCWIERCNQYLQNNGEQPKLTGLNYVLSVLFGVLTLGIWPLINFYKMVNTQNAVNAIYNAQVAA